MLEYSRNCVLDLCDLDGNKVCPIYDSSVEIPQFAKDVVKATDRSGSKTITFTLESPDRDVENFVTTYIKPEYKIRFIDDDGTDWYILDKPKITHSSYSKKYSITADHCSAVLKYRNLELEFSTKKLNNVGTCEELLITTLDGTEWSVGEVYEFKEKYYPYNVKKRTLECSAKTGAFAIIGKICNLFEGKPEFHGDTKKVDILPLNPFSEKSIDPTTGLPDLKHAKNVYEINYGTNMKSMSKTEDSSSITTKLNVYGSYGDTTKGYCGISNLTHTKYTFSTPSAGDYYITIVNPFDSTQIYVNFTIDKAANDLVYMTLDRTSMSYIYDATNGCIYKPTISGIHSGTLIETTTSEEKNWVPFITDITYYIENGIITDGQLYDIAVYQNAVPEVMQKTYEANIQFNNDWNTLVNLVGGTNFVKLKVDNVVTESGHTVLYLNEDEIYYRTDYDKPEQNYFKWRTTNGLKPNGDSINAEASLIYAIYKTGKKYSRHYISAITDVIGAGRKLVLYDWVPTMTLSNYEFYLFESGSVNGKIGGVEVTEMSTMDAANAYPKGDTVKHPVYWGTSQPAISKFTEYAWSVNPTDYGVYFCYKSIDTKWYPATYNEYTPASPSSYQYWYNPKEGKLYRLTSKNPDVWDLFFDAKGAESDEWLRRKKIVQKFAQLMIYRDLYRECWNGKYEQYYYTNEDTTDLKGGNYFYADDYNNGYLFTTTDDPNTLKPGDKFMLNTETGWITPTHMDGSTVDVLAGATWTPGIIDSAGNIYDSITTEISNIITGTDKVTENLIYDCNGTNFTLTWYNEYGLFLRQDKLETNKTIASPANAKQLRVTRQNGATITVTKNSHTDDPLESEVVKLYGSTVTYHTSNIMTDVAWFDGNINDSGEEIDDKTKLRTTWIACYENTTYKSWLPNTATTYVYFYTSKSTYITGSKQQVTNSGTFVSPASACFMRFVRNATDSYYIQVQVKDYTEYIVYDRKQYKQLYKTVDNKKIWNGIGEINGLHNLVPKFKIYADATYLNDRQTIVAYNTLRNTMDKNLVISLGEIYKESTWQDANYVEGDEKKLFFDAVEKLDSASEPKVSYQIGFLDLYNTDLEEYSRWPDIDINSALHILDDQMSENRWAFVNKLNKCYDKPWKTTIEINTNLSTVMDKNFGNVMAEFADISSSVKASDGIIDAVSEITEGKELIASKIAGALNMAKTSIDGAASSWYTDDKGNIIFEAATGKSAMKLCGDGLAIANRKDEYGDWEWTTFGTGDGFTADLISAGTLRGNLIEAGSITADKVNSTFGNELEISSNKSLMLFATVSGSRPAGSVNVTRDGESWISINSTDGIILNTGADINMVAGNEINMNGSTINIKADAGETKSTVNISGGDITLSADSTFTAKGGPTGEEGEITIDKNGVIVKGETIKLDTKDSATGKILLGNENNVITADGIISLNNNSLILDGSVAGKGKITTYGNIEIATNGEQKGSITIDSGAKLDVKSAGAMNIEAGGDLNVASGGDINMNGGNINVNSNGNILVDSTGAIEVKSAGALKVDSGSTLTINSPNLKVNTEGQNEVSVYGTIYAQAGRIGCDPTTHDGGWLITKDELVSGTGDNTVGMSSKEVEDYSVYPTWNSSTAYKKGDKVKIAIQKSGTTTYRVYVATEDNQNKKPNTVSGTAYWNPDPDYIAYWAGDDDPVKAPFRVYRDGTTTLTMLERYNEVKDTTEVIDIRSSLWQMDTAYDHSIKNEGFTCTQDPETEIVTLTITRQDGTELSVNFKKAGGGGDTMAFRSGTTDQVYVDLTNAKDPSKVLATLEGYLKSVVYVNPTDKKLYDEVTLYGKTPTTTAGVLKTEIPITGEFVRNSSTNTLTHLTKYSTSTLLTQTASGQYINNSTTDTLTYSVGEDEGHNTILKDTNATISFTDNPTISDGKVNVTSNVKALGSTKATATKSYPISLKMKANSTSKNVEADVFFNGSTTASLVANSYLNFRETRNETITSILTDGSTTYGIITGALSLNSSRYDTTNNKIFPKVVFTYGGSTLSYIEPEIAITDDYVYNSSSNAVNYQITSSGSTKTREGSVAITSLGWNSLNTKIEAVSTVTSGGKVVGTTSQEVDADVYIIPNSSSNIVTAGIKVNGVSPIYKRKTSELYLTESYDNTTKNLTVVGEVKDGSTVHAKLTEAYTINRDFVHNTGYNSNVQYYVEILGTKYYSDTATLSVNTPYFDSADNKLKADGLVNLGTQIARVKGEGTVLDTSVTASGQNVNLNVTLGGTAFKTETVSLEVDEIGYTRTDTSSGTISTEGRIMYNGSALVSLSPAAPLFSSLKVGSGSGANPDFGYGVTFGTAEIQSGTANVSISDTSTYSSGKIKISSIVTAGTTKLATANKELALESKYATTGNETVQCNTYWNGSTTSIYHTDATLSQSVTAPTQSSPKIVFTSLVKDSNSTTVSTVNKEYDYSAKYVEGVGTTVTCKVDAGFFVNNIIATLDHNIVIPAISGSSNTIELTSNVTSGAATYATKKDEYALESSWNIPATPNTSIIANTKLNGTAATTISSTLAMTLSYDTEESKIIANANVTGTGGTIANLDKKIALTAEYKITGGSSIRHNVYFGGVSIDTWADLAHVVDVRKTPGSSNEIRVITNVTARSTGTEIAGLQDDYDVEGYWFIPSSPNTIVTAKSKFNNKEATSINASLILGDLGYDSSAKKLITSATVKSSGNTVASDENEYDFDRYYVQSESSTVQHKVVLGSTILSDNAQLSLSSFSVTGTSQYNRTVHVVIKASNSSVDPIAVFEPDISMISTWASSATKDATIHAKIKLKGIDAADITTTINDPVLTVLSDVNFSIKSSVGAIAEKTVTIPVSHSYDKPASPDSEIMHRFILNGDTAHPFLTNTELSIANSFSSPTLTVTANVGGGSIATTNKTYRLSNAFTSVTGSPDTMKVNAKITVSDGTIYMENTGATVQLKSFTIIAGTDKLTIGASAQSSDGVNIVKTADCNIAYAFEKTETDTVKHNFTITLPDGSSNTWTTTAPIIISDAWATDTLTVVADVGSQEFAWKNKQYKVSEEFSNVSGTTDTMQVNVKVSSGSTTYVKNTGQTVALERFTVTAGTDVLALASSAKSSDGITIVKSAIYGVTHAYDTSAVTSTVKHKFTITPPEGSGSPYTWETDADIIMTDAFNTDTLRVVADVGTSGNIYNYKDYKLSVDASGSGSTITIAALIDNNPERKVTKDLTFADTVLTGTDDTLYTLASIKDSPDHTVATKLDEFEVDHYYDETNPSGTTVRNVHKISKTGTAIVHNCYADLSTTATYDTPTQKLKIVSGVRARGTSANLIASTTNEYEYTNKYVSTSATSYVIAESKLGNLQVLHATAQLYIDKAGLTITNNKITADATVIDTNNVTVGRSIKDYTITSEWYAGGTDDVTFDVMCNGEALGEGATCSAKLIIDTPTYNTSTKKLHIVAHVDDIATISNDSSVEIVSSTVVNRRARGTIKVNGKTITIEGSTYTGSNVIDKISNGKITSTHKLIHPDGTMSNEIQVTNDFTNLVQQKYNTVYSQAMHIPLDGHKWYGAQGKLSSGSYLIKEGTVGGTSVGKPSLIYPRQDTAYTINNYTTQGTTYSGTSTTYVVKNRQGTVVSGPICGAAKALSTGYYMKRSTTVYTSSIGEYQLRTGVRRTVTELDVGNTAYFYSGNLFSRTTSGTIKYIKDSSRTSDTEYLYNKIESGIRKLDTTSSTVYTKRSSSHYSTDLLSTTAYTDTETKSAYAGGVLYNAGTSTINAFDNSTTKTTLYKSGDDMYGATGNSSITYYTLENAKIIDTTDNITQVCTGGDTIMKLVSSASTSTLFTVYLPTDEQYYYIGPTSKISYYTKK